MPTTLLLCTPRFSGPPTALIVENVSRLLDCWRCNQLSPRSKTHRFPRENELVHEIICVSKLSSSILQHHQCTGRTLSLLPIWIFQLLKILSNAWRQKLDQTSRSIFKIGIVTQGTWHLLEYLCRNVSNRNMYLQTGSEFFRQNQTRG